MTFGGFRSMRFGVLLAPLIGLFGCKPPAPVADAPSKPIAVRTVAVAAQQIRHTTSQPATLQAYYRAEIEARVSGYVQELKVDIGDTVQSGDILAVIHIPEMQKQREIVKARINLFRAQEKQAQAGLELAAANVKSAEAKLAQAKSEATVTEASLAAAEAEFSRTKDLVDRQSLESRVLDEVRKKRDSELARRAAVESAVLAAEADVNVAKAKQTSAQTNVTAAQAESEIAQRQLEELDVMVDYATVKAPLTGIVTDRAIDPGDLVRLDTADEPLLVISQVDRLRVHIPVPEVDAAHVDHGDQVTLTFPSFPAEQEIKTTVTRTAGNLDPRTRTMLVEAELANPDGKFLPGMFGSARIALSTQVAANMLPARAVRFDENGAAYVYLLDENDTVEIIQVATGIDDGQRIEIVSGVQAGERVIDAHLKRFSSGQKVSVLN